MKKILVVLIGLLLSFTSLEASAFKQELKIRELTGVVTSAKEITVGKNIFILSFKKRSQCITHAKIVAHLSLKEANRKNISNLTIPARHLGGGKYKFVANLPTNGTWYVDLVVTPALGATQHVKTTFIF